jgi:hypothetical protein
MSWQPTSSSPMCDPSCDGLGGSAAERSRAAAPLVKPTLRGILPHGSEVPWGPIPLRSEGLDDSPRWRAGGAEFIGDEFLFPLPRTLDRLDKSSRMVAAKATLGELNGSCTWDGSSAGRAGRQLGAFAGASRLRPWLLNVLLQLEIERLSDDVGLLSASSTCEIPQAALCSERPTGSGLVQSRGLPQ